MPKTKNNNAVPAAALAPGALIYGAARQRARAWWRSALLWGLGAALALLAIGAVMQQAAREQLQSDAAHAARAWADFLRDTVPDLEPAFAGQGFSADALVQLKRLRQADEVFRFKLYDRQGLQLLSSDDLDHPPPAGTALHLGNGSRRADAAARALVLGGAPLIRLQQGTPPASPEVYSEAYVPVLRDGRVLGVVEVYVDQGGRAGRIHDAFRTVALAVALLMLALAGAGGWQWLQRNRATRRAEEHVRYLAHHDVLTGALNRSSFHDALAQAQAQAVQQGRGFAVLCIDLDRFKEVNDTLGHAAGDELLRVVSQRLQQLVRQGDALARLGGDEFAVLQAGVHGADDVGALAQRIVDALAEPCELSGHRVQVAGSVGAAVYGTDGTGREELLHRADLALYRAKSNGRGTFSFYDPDMDQQLQARRAIVRDLRQALLERQLHLHFQALYESDGRTLSGYEALLRWTHPQRGPIPPAEFIPIAEESGLIEELGRWVLSRACREARRWPASLSVSVNLSAAQFKRGNLVQTVADCLAKAGLPAHRLELEITESLLMSNTEQVVQTLHALTGMGVRIAMDDFGTGYSSLAYLWRFPFDKVKIDRAFTQNLDQDPKVDLIVRSIVTLAHSLDIRVNAEGVETQAQLQRLQDHGCDELQGFLLGRPTPVEALNHRGAAAAKPPTLPRAQTDFAPLATMPMPLPTQPMPL